MTIISIASSATSPALSVDDGGTGIIPVVFVHLSPAMLGIGPTSSNICEEIGEP